VEVVLLPTMVQSFRNQFVRSFFLLPAGAGFNFGFEVEVEMFAGTLSTASTVEKIDGRIARIFFELLIEQHMFLL
jgi:hypothetical protein